jgi:hypothetical protein
VDKVGHFFIEWDHLCSGLCSTNTNVNTNVQIRNLERTYPGASLAKLPNGLCQVDSQHGGIGSGSQPSSSSEVEVVFEFGNPAADFP